jgi:phosphoglycolate phosphatase
LELSITVAEYVMRKVIFDLDGTLIDSEPDLRAALNRLLAGKGLAPLERPAVTRMIGDGAKVLVTRALAVYRQEATGADLAAFLEDYESHAADETVVYPGIIAALTDLRAAGYPLALCTNKPSQAARNVLEAFGLDAFFTAVVGGDATAYRKPDPRHLAVAVEALGGGEAVMVGDHANDIAAAHGLGIPAIFAAWGYGTATGTYTAQAASELPGIVKGM